MINKGIMKRYTQFQIVTFTGLLIILSVFLFYKKLQKNFPDYVPALLLFGTLAMAIIFLLRLKIKSSVKSLDYKQAFKPKKLEVFFMIFLLISLIVYSLMNKIEIWKIILLAIGGLLSYYIYIVYTVHIADQFRDNIDKNK